MVDWDDVVPRLARGNHPYGSFKICMMNLVCWEDRQCPVTDTPRSVAVAVARFLHTVNDSMCHHPQVDDPALLCPPCSMTVMDIGHQVVGTGGATQELHWRWAVALLGRAVEIVQAAAPPTRSEYVFYLDPAGWPVIRNPMPVDVLVRHREYAARQHADADTVTPIWGDERSAGHGLAEHAGGHAGAALTAIRPYVTQDEWVQFARDAVALWHELAGTTVTDVPDEVVRSAARQATEHPAAGGTPVSSFYQQSMASHYTPTPFYPPTLVFHPTAWMPKSVAFPALA